MPLNIPKPQLASAEKLTAFDMTKIHFGSPSRQSSSDKLQKEDAGKL